MQGDKWGGVGYVQGAPHVRRVSTTVEWKVASLRKLLTSTQGTAVSPL